MMVIVATTMSFAIIFHMGCQVTTRRVARLRLGGRPTLSGVGDVTEEGPAAGVLAGVREEGAVLEMAWEGKGEK